MKKRSYYSGEYANAQASSSTHTPTGVPKSGRLSKENDQVSDKSEFLTNTKPVPQGLQDMTPKPTTKSETKKQHKTDYEELDKYNPELEKLSKPKANNDEAEKKKKEGEKKVPPAPPPPANAKAGPAYSQFSISKHSKMGPVPASKSRVRSMVSEAMTPHPDYDPLVRTLENPTLMVNDPAYKAIAKKFREEHKIELGVTIGSGASALVVKGAYFGTGKKIAAKIIDMRGKTAYINKFLPREIEMAKKLVHNNIVRVYDVINFEHYTAFVLEYCACGDLLMKIQAKNFLTDQESRFIFRQLMEAMVYLEKHQVVHRDIKCENIFMDEFGNAKLGDFGFARVLGKGEMANTMCGSPAYVAPEVQDNEKYTRYCDVWSMGAVLFIMLTGFLPYDGEYSKTNRPELKFYGDPPPCEDAQRLISQMLRFDPKDRITVKKIMQEPYVKSTPYVMKTSRNNSKD